MANTNFLRIFLPERDISIDESMVPFKGRNFMRQYTRMKNIKWGMKVWGAAASDTEYILQFDVYSGRRP